MGVFRKLLDGIWESVRGQSETHYKLLKRSSVLVTVLLPAIFGLITTFRDDWFGNNPVIFWCIITALVL